MSAYIAKITIGLPVYNGEATLRKALDSLLAQTFQDFILIISDNASTDKTELICREFAQKDSRIMYFRQSENIGADKNFRFVFSKASSEYFSWAAADDVRSEDFLQENLNFLEKNPDFITSTSPSRFENGDFHEIAMGDASLNGDVEKRLIRFFSCWHANSRFYGLFRSEVLQKSYPLEGPYLGADWAIILRCCMLGKTNVCKSGWLIRGADGASNRKDIFEKSRNHWYEYFLPFSELSYAVFKMTTKFSLKSRCRLLLCLLKLNIDAVRASRRFSRT